MDWAGGGNVQAGADHLGASVVGVLMVKFGSKSLGQIDFDGFRGLGLENGALEDARRKEYKLEVKSDLNARERSTKCNRFHCSPCDSEWPCR